MTRGYKGLNENMVDICGNHMQYEIGVWYEVDEELEPSCQGFHFSKTIEDVTRSYPFLGSTRLFEVEADGEMRDIGEEVVASRIRLIREVHQQEILFYAKENLLFRKCSSFCLEWASKYIVSNCNYTDIPKECRSKISALQTLEVLSLTSLGIFPIVVMRISFHVNTPSILLIAPLAIILSAPLVSDFFQKVENKIKIRGIVEQFRSNYYK